MDQLLVDKAGLLFTRESTLFWAYMWLDNAAWSEYANVRYSLTFAAVTHTMTGLLHQLWEVPRSHQCEPADFGQRHLKEVYEKV